MSSQKDRTVDVMLRRPHFLRTPLPDPTPTYANYVVFSRPHPHFTSLFATLTIFENQSSKKICHHFF